jgi:hypothetical protein
MSSCLVVVVVVEAAGPAAAVAAVIDPPAAVALHLGHQSSTVVCHCLAATTVPVAAEPAQVLHVPAQPQPEPGALVLPPPDLLECGSPLLEVEGKVKKRMIGAGMLLLAAALGLAPPALLLAAVGVMCWQMLRAAALRGAPHPPDHTSAG